MQYASLSSEAFQDNSLLIKFVTKMQSYFFFKTVVYVGRGEQTGMGFGKNRVWTHLQKAIDLYGYGRMGWSGHSRAHLYGLEAEHFL